MFSYKRGFKFLAFLFIMLGLSIPGVLLLGHTDWGVSDSDRLLLKQAYLERQKVPKGGYAVGAVVAQNGRVIGRGFSNDHVSGDPRDHAESIAVLDALRRSKKRRFEDNKVTVYTTYEPCPMCEGFLVWMNVTRVVCGRKKKFFFNLRSRWLRYLKYYLNLRTA